MPQKKQRWLPDIEHLQSLAILLVVFGHSRYGTPENDPSWFLVVREFISSFHMPLFAAASGVLFMHGSMAKGHLNWRRLVTSKSRRLLIPYFTIISAVYFLRLILIKLHPEVVHLHHDLSWSSWLKVYVDPDCSPLNFYWFIVALFWIFALFGKPMFEIVRRKNIPLIVLGTVACLLLKHFPIGSRMFYLQNAFGLAIYFWAGCVFYLIKDRVDRLNPLLMLGIIVPIWLAVTQLSRGDYHLGQVSKEVTVLAGITGMLMAYFFVQIYVRRDWRFLEPIDGYSYSIYLLSWFGHRAAEVAVTLTLGLSGFYVLCPLSFLLATAGPILATKLVENRMPALRLLVGVAPARKPSIETN
ncbi:MAG: acyltransferase [Planctomycetaceae bacterium]|nr:acyltransferase [Planctomycetaceae bacterium]